MSNIQRSRRAGGAADPVYVDDVFSTYLYTGTGAALDIVNGIDLAGEGGMVWFKCRNQAINHVILDTERGVGKGLYSNSSTIEATNLTDVLTAFNTAGFSLGTDATLGGVNYNSTFTYASWTFRNQFNFFKVLAVTKASGSNLIIDLSPYMDVPGMVKVKRTDAAGSWYIWHRSLTAGKLLIGETTTAEATLGHITVSGTTLTLVDGTIDDGDYHIECYAHDPLGPSGDGSDGLIACGSFTTDGAGGATVNHGWSAGAQYAQIKVTNTTGIWEIYDTARTAAWSGNDARLLANSSVVEDAVARLSASGTSITFSGLELSKTYIYTFVVAPTV